MLALTPEEPPGRVDGGEPESLVEKRPKDDPGTRGIVLARVDDSLAQHVADELGVVGVRERMDASAADRLGEHSPNHVLDVGN
jgi:hypothetical protein